MGNFRFGVDSIDRLISREDGLYGSYKADRLGIPKTEECEPFVGCIVGPDGTGKSVLALHAAATYLADTLHSRIPHDLSDNNASPPSVIYLSTDLSHAQASTIWRKFGLDRPCKRASAFATARVDADEPLPRTAELASKFTNEDEPLLSLRRISPFASTETSESSPITSVCDEKLFGSSVGFLDLAAETAGDDWALINRILGARADVNRQDTRPSLVVIDAIEGLEALIGENDAFGLARSRRSRLAQLIRLAKRANTSILLVIEETRDFERLDEVFVSDLVIRLRATPNYGYLQRTLEVEKARGFGHTRGEHNFVVRSGRGTRTLGEPNWDDPELSLSPGTSDDKLSYLIVIPTLHVKDQDFTTSSAPALNGIIFGLPEIDALVAGRNGTHSVLNDRLMAVIGESGTHKSALVEQFCRAGLGVAGVNENERGGALILSSEQSSSQTWIEQLTRLKTHCGLASIEEVQKRFRIRHLPVNHMTSNQFVQILLANIRKMKASLQLDGEHGEPWRLRVVIENWAVLMESHPTLREDEMLLRKTVWHLNSERVTALFVSRQAGSPPMHGVNPLPHDISQLDIRKICTWPVYFFGGQKVAITVYPPPPGNDRNEIYGLESSSDSGGLLTLDHDFLLYSGLEEGRPERVPLRVRLYSEESGKTDGTPAAHYLRLCTDTMNSLFYDATETSRSGVVAIEWPSTYVNYRNYVDSFDRTRVAYSELLQVDQFWATEDEKGFADLRQYLNRPTGKIISNSTTSRWEPDARVDPFREFRPSSDVPTAHSAELAKTSRRTFIMDPWATQGASAALENESADTTQATRIPLYADFGFILANRSMWWNARHKVLFNAEDGDSVFFDEFDLNDDADNDGLDPATDEEGDEDPRSPWLGDYVRYKSVGQVWNALCRPEDRFEDIWDEDPEDSSTAGPPAVSWQLFFIACQKAAAYHDAQAFDVEFNAENLSCLILEIWLSVIKQFFTTSTEGPIDEWKRKIDAIVEPLSREFSGGGNAKSAKCNLAELIEHADPFLFATLELLRNVFPQKKLLSKASNTRSVDPNSAAIRTWYSTATDLQTSNRELLPLAMPGTHVCRGDWYLAVPSGTRSMVLAQRAMDKLLSADLTIQRLSCGIGLPRRTVFLQTDSPVASATPDFDTQKNMQTAVMSRQAGNEFLEPLNLGELLKLGIQDGSNRQWIWRSQISGYTRIGKHFVAGVTEYIHYILTNYDQNRQRLAPWDFEEWFDDNVWLSTDLGNPQQNWLATILGTTERERLTTALMDVAWSRLQKFHEVCKKIRGVQ